MRDSLLEEIFAEMCSDDRIFFLSDDMGAPVLDQMRAKFRDRFINVGIAEQNMINVATGLALEGFSVYAYAIAPFFMRAYEQIRVNLALTGQLRKLNVNMIAVGAGLGYDVSGPTHHCLEDIIIMRALPNLLVFSPSDWVCAKSFVEYSLKVQMPKYIRLDGKPLPRIYQENSSFDWDRGFSVLAEGRDVCAVTTGYETQVLLNVLERLAQRGQDVGLVDIFMLKPLDVESLRKCLGRYKHVVTVEEGFVEKGGLDAIVSQALSGEAVQVKSLGCQDRYLFKYGSRDFLHQQDGFGGDDIVKLIAELCVG